SKMISPELGFSSPMRLRRMTLLPVPLPPNRTMISPGKRSRFTPWCTFFAPKLLYTLRMDMIGCFSISSFLLGVRPNQNKKLRQKEIRDHDENIRRHDDPGRRVSNAPGSAAGVHAAVTSRERDEDGEHHRLDVAHQEVGHAKRLDRLGDEEVRGL